MAQDEILRNIEQSWARDVEEKKKMLCAFEEVLIDKLHCEYCPYLGNCYTPEFNAICEKASMIYYLYHLLSCEPNSESAWFYGKVLQSSIDQLISPTEKTFDYDPQKEAAKHKKREQIEAGLKQLYKDNFQDKEGYADRFYYPISVLLPMLIHNKGMLWHSIEEDTLPLIDLLNICQQSEQVTFKTHGMQAKTIDLNSRSASLLSSMISEYLKDKIRDFHKITTPSEMKGLLLSWHREKVDVISEKYLVGKFLCRWLDTIKWEDTHTITDKRNIAYSIGAIVGLYEIDESKDRKERADFVKNKINSYVAQLGKK